jgi:hypothetical protein
MNNYKHVNEITELAASRIRWMAAAYVALGFFILTLILVGCDKI